MIRFFFLGIGDYVVVYIDFLKGRVEDLKSDFYFRKSFSFELLSRFFFLGFASIRLLSVFIGGLKL